MQLASSSIFVNLKVLRTKLYRVQFMMDKSARIIYGTPLMQMCGECIKYFTIAFLQHNERKLEYLDLCIGCYAVLRADMDFVIEENIIHFPHNKPQQTNAQNKAKANVLPEELVSRQKILLFELVGKIDNDMLKWRASLTKGKTVCA